MKTRMNSVFIWGSITIVVLCIFLYIYTSSLANSRANTYIYKYGTPNMTNNQDGYGSENIWYGLNPTGMYRDYGREYGGRFSPGRVYGHGHGDGHGR